MYYLSVWGNICRSPLAEGIFTHLVAQAKLSETITADSAGTGAWHIGESPDNRSTAIAAKHGISLHHQARIFQDADFERFDLILAMDSQNLVDILAKASTPAQRAKVKRLGDYDPAHVGDVPDPYYGGILGFERVYQQLERCCRALLTTIST
jgi:protein-tyrosine phosphatase